MLIARTLSVSLLQFLNWSSVKGSSGVEVPFSCGLYSNIIQRADSPMFTDHCNYVETTFRRS